MDCVHKMIDATSIREGFRVFRIQAESLLFKLANGSRTIIDDNNGANYIVPTSGRYVVESGNGCRRVSDAQIADCLRSQRPNDRFLQLTLLHASDWPDCFASYIVSNESSPDWITIPMQRSTSILGAWTVTMESPAGIDCAFYDGNSIWDSNNMKNYRIRLPGRYILGRGTLTYQGVSEMDLHYG